MSRGGNHYEHHLPDCPCKPCRGRRGEQRKGVRCVRLDDNLWQWLQVQPGGPAGWITRRASAEKAEEEGLLRAQGAE